jgi:sigma-B regulation protein RsbU (phosphoserine phosphatase)
LRLNEGGIKENGMKRTFIKTKILRAFLLVCSGSLVISSMVTMISLIAIQRITTESGSQIGAAAAENSAESLLDLALSDISDLVRAKSDIIGQDVGEAINSVEIVTGYIEQLYNHREEFRLVKIPNFREVPPGELRLHWFLEGGILQDPRYTENDLSRAGLLEEAYLLGNVERIDQLIVKTIPNIFTMYLSTKSGLNIHYDADASLKFEMASLLPALRERPWYINSRDTNALYISEPYQDFAERGLCIAITKPYYRGSGEFMGVAGIDIGIEDLDRTIRETVVGMSGYALLINTNAGEDRNRAEIISAPNLNGETKNSIAAYLGDAAEKIVADMRATPHGIGRSVITTETETSAVYVVWAPVRHANWHLVYVAPENDILAPSITLRNEIIRMTGDSTKSVTALMYTAILLSGILLAAIILVTLWTAGLLASRIARPITILSEGVKKISSGNLEYRSEIKTGDEIEELSLNFERMGRELMVYIKNLNSVTAEKERIGAELTIATKIQASMLPGIFPAFPDREEFDVYASMLPAKEVGGDFYDFFLVEKNILAMLIADVSGKGVPAALFMVIAKTLIKNNAQHGLSPKDVFATVNNLLCANNEEGMFVTVFMGFLDILTGTLTCVNAGHNPPLIKRGDRFEWLRIKPGLFLGGMENTTYHQEELYLKSGDVIYLYTDGVTEAMNPQREQFTESRLLEAVDAHKDCGVQEFAVSIKDAIDTFVEGAEQADDITMLVLKYKGLPAMGN